MDQGRIARASIAGVSASLGYPDIWLRRSFELQEAPGDSQFLLNILHDEGTEVYLNGTPVRSFKRFVKSYQLALLDEDACKLLRVGRNTIAVHCRQTTGAQYIDAGIIEVVEQR